MPQVTPCKISWIFAAAVVVLVQLPREAPAETVTLANGQSYEVETDTSGEPIGVENRQVAFNFLGLTSRASPPADAPVWAWVLNVRLKRNRDYRVTVTTPLSTVAVETFDVSGRGESVHRFFDSSDYPGFWSWLEDPGISWIPFVFHFDDMASDEEFELTQWTKFVTRGKYLFLRNSYIAAALEFPSDHPSNETVVPPFDDRNWKVGSQAVSFPQVVTEFVLEDETIDEWSELVTVHSFIGAQEANDLEGFTRLAREAVLGYCPTAMWNVIDRGDTRVIAESRTENCVGPNDSDDQYEILGLVRGQWAMHRVAYTTKRQPHLPDAARGMWIERMRALELGLSDWTANLGTAGLRADEESVYPASADENEALIYLLREPARPREEFAVFVEDQPVASLPPLSYATVAVEPGWHLLWGEASAAWFRFEAGREYFLRMVGSGYGWMWLVEDLSFLNRAITSRNLQRIEPTEAVLAPLREELDRYERVRRRAGDPPEGLYPAEVDARYRSEPPGALAATIFGLGGGGTLTVTESELTYTSKDEELTIPIDSIRLATIVGPQLDWLVVEYTQDSGDQAAFFGGAATSAFNNVVLAIQNAHESLSSASIE